MNDYKVAVNVGKMKMQVEDDVVVEGEITGKDQVDATTKDILDIIVITIMKFWEY